MKRFAVLMLLLSSSFVFAKTVSSVAIAPQGAVLQNRSTLQFSVICTYSDATTDNCAAAGGATWTATRPTQSKVDAAGLATWIADPGAGRMGMDYIVVKAGGLNDRAALYGQHPGDTWYQYPTPDYRNYFDPFVGAPVPRVAVGATVTMGSGVVVNEPVAGNATGTPFQTSCNWKSSDLSIATVDRHGQTTALAPGMVTITCGRGGDGVFGSSTAAGWQAPGNVITLTIVPGGTGNSTWYVRPDGGTPFVNASQTPAGQCDGKMDASYPGTGVNQHCAVHNLRDLWADGVSPFNMQWMISGGDTVIVAQNPNGYNLGLDQASPYQNPGGSDWVPVNCKGNPSCTMPSIPSGTPSQHTRILGANYGSCHSDGAKTQLIVSYAASSAISVGDSQFVDVGCFEITDKAQCSINGMYRNACNNGMGNFGRNGIAQSALSSYVNYTDIFIHGLANEGVNGATGVGVVANYLHIRGVPMAGIDMDDGPWSSSNISVAGGFTMNYSITEFVGCVEEYPVTHNYPYVECRDQNTGAYGDGLGTGSTVGAWSFDHDLWYANFQDGLDLLHSGMQTLSITNSKSIANDGQAYKVGSADHVTFTNNIAANNCARVGYPFGDEPLSAIVPGVTLCRAAGDALVFHFTDLGTYTVQNNTFMTYGATPFDLFCEDGWDACSNAATTFQNNAVLGYSNPQYNLGFLPALFYMESSPMPVHNGWKVRDHNIYYNIRNGWCPTPLQASETCNTVDPKFAVEPASPLFSEAILDTFDYSPGQSSPLIGGGVSLANVLSDINGVPRPATPSIGAIEFAAAAQQTVPQVTLTAAPNVVTAGQSVTVSVTVTGGGGLPTGSVTLLDGVANLAVIALNSSGTGAWTSMSLTAGAHTLTATYAGDSNYLNATSNITVLTVQPIVVQPVVSTIALSATPNAATPGQLVTLTANVSGGGKIATGTVQFLDGGVSLGSGTLNGAGVASYSTTGLGNGVHALTAAYAGDATYSGSASAQVSLTVARDPNAVTISVAQPTYGFNVIPGSTRRIFATVKNGSTNVVSWAMKSGSGTISSSTGTWIDVTAPGTGTSCSITGTPGQYGVTSATTFTVEASSLDDATQVSDITFNVCSPSVEVSVVPFYRALYVNQPAELQSIVVGSSDQTVRWGITSQPNGGDGQIVDSTARDTVFTATVAGRYTLSATSQADRSKSSTAVVYVTGNALPYRVTPSMTMPVDCTADPAMVGTVYEVGPSQAFKSLALVPFPTLVPGSTVRLHNEDTTGINPTQYHEYVQISQAGTANQPIRVCGVPDAAGRLPIVDGANATGRSDTDAAAVGAGLMTVHSSNTTAKWPAFGGAAYVSVEGIQFRNAKPGSSYTSPSGAPGQWQATSSCVRVNQVQHAAFVGNDFGNCANGVVSVFRSDAGGGWGNSDTNVLWEGNHVHDNGVAGSSAGHQMSLQAWGEVVQFNRIDNYVGSALGANIQSRGVQGVVRYNYFGDGPQRQMDLVDVVDGSAYMSFAGFLDGGANSFHAVHGQDTYTADRIAAMQEAWNTHYVYGNIYANSTSQAPFHFSMDTSGGELARKGSLYWYNNTFYAKGCAGCSGPVWTLFDTSAGGGNYMPQTEFQNVQVYNNVIWLDTPATPGFQWNNNAALIAKGGNNLIASGWGTNSLTGGTGTGWNAASNANAYQNAGQLSLHVSGFDNTNLATAAAIPFDSISWILGNNLASTMTVPSAVCEMPTRFAYLPNLGYAVPRIGQANVGATDTVAQTAKQMNAVAGTGRYNTRYSTCR